jgi:hypothetical protein
MEVETREVVVELGVFKGVVGKVALKEQKNEMP